MGLFDFFKSEETTVELNAVGDTLEEALASLNSQAAALNLEPSGEGTEYYCGICGKMMNVSHFPH